MRSYLALVLLCVAPSLAFGQPSSPGMRVTGAVQDATHAGIPEAKVTLKRSGATGATGSTTADLTGVFAFDGLRPRRL